MARTKPVSWKLKERAIRALERDGIVLTDDLIEAARDPRHPCHGDFTWSIEAAARERWHDQARALIRRVHFELEYDEVTLGVVSYVPTPGTEGRQFISLPRLRSKAQVLAMFDAELAQAHGLLSRICGLAAAKQRVLGEEAVERLGAIRNSVAALRADLCSEQVVVR